MKVEKRSAVTRNRWVVSGEHFPTILDLKTCWYLVEKIWKVVQNRLKKKSSNDTDITNVCVVLMDWLNRSYSLI